MALKFVLYVYGILKIWASLILKAVCWFKNMIMMFYKFMLNIFGGNRQFFPCCQPQRESLISLRSSQQFDMHEPFGV